MGWRTHPCSMDDQEEALWWNSHLNIRLLMRAVLMAGHLPDTPCV